MYIIVKVFPSFNYMEILFISYSLIAGHFIFKYSHQKSRKILNVRFNKNEIFFEDIVINVNEVKNIYVKKLVFYYYPKITIELINKQKINFRIDKNEKDYDDFITKINSLKF